MGERSRATRILARIGLLTVIALGISLAVALFEWLHRGRVPAVTVLALDLRETLVESPPRAPLALLKLSRASTVLDVVETLERAGGDPRVKGLVARIGGASHGLAVVEELRDAVGAFRRRGKFAIAFADSFGEGSPGNQAYDLATAFDEIWLQPSGEVALMGLRAEVPFLRGALAKLHVVPQIDKRKQYKTAPNTFTETGFTDAQRESLTALTQDLFSRIVSDVAEGRKLEPAEVRRLCDRGPFLAKEALDARLVDRLAYVDEAVAEAEARAGDGAELLDADDYLGRAGRPHAEGPKIALVYGVGAVVRGESRSVPFFGGATLGAETVGAAIHAAVEDGAVRAIVFRIDSPGGSYVASDAIWRETQRAKKAGKPIIVSMGNVAGSGGYFIAADAAQIVAEPGTITGSIGVFAGKPVTTGFWNRLGVQWDAVETSANAGMWATTEEFSPYGWQRLESSLDAIYRDFVEKVASGRSLPLERVHEIAKGRVWSGEAAKRIGLVDELGGFPTALRLAREAAGLGPEAGVTLELFPPRRSLFERWLRGEAESDAERWSVGLERLGSIRRRLATLAPRPAPLGLPPLLLSP